MWNVLFTGPNVCGMFCFLGSDIRGMFCLVALMYGDVLFTDTDI